MKKLVLVFVTVIMVMLSSCKKEEAPQPRSPQPQPSQNDDLISEIVGCMDPTSLNYNPEATISNGSCEYADEEVGEEIVDFYFEIRHSQITWGEVDRVEIIQRINNEVEQTFTITQDMIVYGTTSDRSVVIKFDEQYISADIMDKFRNTDYRNSNYEVKIWLKSGFDKNSSEAGRIYFGDKQFSEVDYKGLNDYDIPNSDSRIDYYHANMDFEYI